MYTIIYYTNNQIAIPLQQFCLDRIDKISRKDNAELITVSWEPISIGRNIILEDKQGPYSNIYRQILKGLEASSHEHIFLCEHDVLYPESHFLSTMPLDSLMYNSNLMHLNKHGFFRPQEVNFLSTLSGHRKNVDMATRARLRELEKYGYVVWAELAEPISTKRIYKDDIVIDIRHNNNLTGYRTSETYLDTIPYWGNFKQYTKLL